MTHLPIRLGMVFGVFDGLHAGHKFFLSEAARMCEKLIVVVTLPEVVVSLKAKLPRQEFSERAKAIERYNDNLIVIPGDMVLGSWEVLTDHQPDIVFLGYDQQGIAGELDRFSVPYLYVGSFEPERYKSSLMKYFMYILQCSDGTLYSGCTNDLEKRLHEHNNSKRGAHYTKIRRPVEMVYREGFDTLSEARSREAEIKRLSRDMKLTLIGHK